MSRKELLTQPGAEPEKSDAGKPSAAKRRKATQVLRRLLAAAGVLGVLSLGVAFATLYAADSAFIAGALSRLLGRHVEIGSVAFHFGRRLEVELWRAKVADPSGPEAPLTLEVAHARVQAGPGLAGQLLPLDWTLDAPLLRLHASSTGAAFDPASLPRLGLSVTDGRVEWKTAAGEIWSLERLKLDAQCASCGTRIDGEENARVTHDKNLISELALHFSAARPRQPARHARRVELDLAARARDSRGRAEGGFDLTVDRAGVRGRAHLEVDRFELTIPKYTGPIAPKTAQVAADVDWRAANLSLELHPLQLDDLVASGSVHLGTGTNGRLIADLQLQPFEPGRKDRVSGVNFLTQRFASWSRVKLEMAALLMSQLLVTCKRRGSFEKPR
jgi:hypothetical protein